MSRWLIKKAGVKITVRCKGKHAEELLEPILQDMNAVRVKASSGVRLLVKGEPGFWHMRDREDDIKRRLKHAGDLIYHLSDRMVFHIADKSDQVHCLHAAAAGKDGKALVIPASSGSGKSTFIAWLVANGFEYLTDELILLRDRKIEGLSRPIQIKTTGVKVINTLLQTPGSLHEGKLANAVTPADLGGKTAKSGEFNLGMIVYIKYAKGAQFSFEKISSSDAGMNLMANHVNARNLEGHGFSEMMEIIRNTPCYSLQYGGFETLPADFAEQLGALLSGES